MTDKEPRLQDKLRQCAEQAQIGNPIWMDRARQLMMWAADALDAADLALIDETGALQALNNADKPMHCILRSGVGSGVSFEGG